MIAPIEPLFIDHFDGRSLRRRTAEWLQSALADCEVRIADCERLGSDPHLRMWRNIKSDYAAELRSRWKASAP